MKLQAKGFRWTADSTGEWLCVMCNRPQQVLDEIQEGKPYDVEIKQHRERRSKNANAYSWVLTDKLADELLVRGVKLSKEEMHAEMIFRYGQLLHEDNGDVVVVRAPESINLQQFFPYAQPFMQSEEGDQLITHYRVYRESHTYNSREFTIFLNGIIEECKDLGIETMTPEELARLEGYEAQEVKNEQKDHCGPAGRSYHDADRLCPGSRPDHCRPPY